MTHRFGDERIADWLDEHGYHPRSPKHGSASCLFLLDDLLHASDPFRETARAGEIVYQEDYTVGSGQDRWNTDLVVGPPGDDEVDPDPDPDGREIATGSLDAVWLAVDAKSVMTEHGKARRNRQRDINSFADIMHTHFPGAVTGGLLLVNAADRFRSPLRDDGDVTEHDDVTRLVEETIDIFRSIEYSGGSINHNVDAVGCVVVEHTNLDDGTPTRLVTDRPAPPEGDSVHYRRFVGTLAELFEERFLLGDPPAVGEGPDAERLRRSLNRQAVELVHLVHEVGRSMDDPEFDPDRLDECRDAIRAIETALDDIESAFADR